MAAALASQGWGNPAGKQHERERQANTDGPNTHSHSSFAHKGPAWCTSAVQVRWQQQHQTPSVFDQLQSPPHLTAVVTLTLQTHTELTTLARMQPAAAARPAVCASAHPAATSCCCCIACASADAAAAAAAAAWKLHQELSCRAWLPCLHHAYALGHPARIRNDATRHRVGGQSNRVPGRIVSKQFHPWIRALASTHHNNCTMRRALC